MEFRVEVIEEVGVEEVSEVLREVGGGGEAGAEGGGKSASRV